MKPILSQKKRLAQKIATRRHAHRNAGGRRRSWACLSALVGVNLFRRADEAKRTAARAQIDSFMTALGAYKLDTGSFPSTEQGLQALRVKPENSDQWAGPYLPKEMPMDPVGPSISIHISRRPRR